MNTLERAILAYISERSIPGQMRPTKGQIYRAFGNPAAKHPLNMLQINVYVGVLPHRRTGGVKRYEIRAPGIEALKRIAA